MIFFTTFLCPPGNCCLWSCKIAGHSLLSVCHLSLKPWVMETVFWSAHGSPGLKTYHALKEGAGEPGLLWGSHRAPGFSHLRHLDEVTYRREIWTGPGRRLQGKILHNPSTMWAGGLVRQEENWGDGGRNTGSISSCVTNHCTSVDKALPLCLSVTALLFHRTGVDRVQIQ